MNVIIDTCVWSETLRKRKTNQILADELTELVREGRVILLGAIRQELLSGVKADTDFEKIKKYLRAFDDYIVSEEDYEYAAKLFNIYRKKGIQGANTDFLICSVAIRSNFLIFTTDKDFSNFAKHIDIKFYNMSTVTSN